MSRVAPLALGSTSDQDELAVVGERTFAQRDAECRKRDTDLDMSRRLTSGAGVAVGALEERVVGARSIFTAAVDARVRELRGWPR